MNSFLLLLSALIIISLIFIYQSKTGYQWKAILFAVIGTGVIFTASALVLKRVGVLSYNLEAFIADDGAGIPFEIIISAFVFPLGGIAIYNFLNKRYPDQRYEKYSLALSNILMGLCIAVIFFAYNKWYPMFTFILMILTLLFVEYKNKIRFMYRFYRAYLLSVIAFLVVNVTYHYQGHIRYTEVQTLSFDLIFIPFEGFFYLFDMVLIGVLLFEIFKKKYKLV
jgi:hypothetical protein